MCSITQVTIATSSSVPPVIAVTNHIVRFARFEAGCFKTGSSAIGDWTCEVSVLLQIIQGVIVQL